MGAVSRTSSAVVGLLAEPERLRVVSALALGAGTIPEVARGGRARPAGGRAGAAPAGAGRARARDKEQLTLHTELFKQAAREAAPDEPGRAALGRPGDRRGAADVHPGRPDHRLPGPAGAPAAAARGRGRGLRTGRALSGEGGQLRSSRAWYGDHATLRRYLVDELLLDRSDGAVLADRRSGRNRPTGARSGSSGWPRTGWWR